MSSGISSMGGIGDMNHFGAPHSDVLIVTINESTTSEQRETLYVELQRRSKAAVQAKQWPDAVALYSKAIECCCNGNGNGNGSMTNDSNQYQHQLPLTKATLNANISLCLGKMNRWTEAVTSAQQSVEIDSSYMKGWYRLGQAQGNSKEYGNAIASLERAIQLDPENKVLLNDLEKYKIELEAQQKDLAEQKEKMDAIVSGTSATTVTTSITQEKIHKTSKDDDVDMTVLDSAKDDVDDSGFTKSDYVRGYKIVNGKKTSYFHNELSEDAKKLIGDIAPKKIDPSNSNELLTKTTTSDQGTSAWNKAGTWEEKDCTVWATETITDLLTKITYTLPESSPAPNAKLSIPKTVVQSSSHASFATVRSKKRYIYELDIIIHWNFVHNDLSASGTIRFPDIDGTCALGDGYDATEYNVIQIDDPTLQPVLTQFCYQQGLRLRIHETIDDWVRLFKDTY
jgi:tetratricopeptide (TPR) repeat protein